MEFCEVKKIMYCKENSRHTEEIAYRMGEKKNFANSTPDWRLISQVYKEL